MELSPKQVQSLNILLNAVQVAQQRGAFSLADAHAIQEAVDQLVPREEQGKDPEASEDAEQSEEQVPDSE
jgi:hypothetical protein